MRLRLAGVLLVVLTACGSSSSSKASGESKASGDICALSRDLAGTNIEKDITTADSAQIKKQLKTANDVMTKLVAQAPAEIKADAKTMATAMSQLDKVLGKYNYDFKKLVAAATTDPSVKSAVESALDGADVGAATKRVSAYLDKTCGTAK